MAIGKKVKKKSNSTIEAVRQVAQNTENARNVKGISTQRKSYMIPAQKKLTDEQRQALSNKVGQKRMVGAKIRDNGMAQASWGSKIRAPKASDNGNAMMESGRYRTAHAARVKNIEQTRQNTVKNTKIGSVGAKNKTRTVQSISDFPVTFVNDARSRADNLSRGVVDSYKKREKKRKR